MGSVILQTDFASWNPPQGVGYRKANSQKTNPVVRRLVDLRNLHSCNRLNQPRRLFSTGFVSSLFCFHTHVDSVRPTLRVGYREGQRLTNADAREDDSELVGKVRCGEGVVADWYRRHEIGYLCGPVKIPILRKVLQAREVAPVKLRAGCWKLPINQVHKPKFIVKNAV